MEHHSHHHQRPGWAMQGCWNEWSEWGGGLGCSVMPRNLILLIG